jgi:hypothetical protein
VSDQQPPGWTPPQQPPDQPPTGETPSWPPPPPPPPPPQQPTQQWGPPPGPSGYQQYGYPGYAGPRKTEGNAIAALVLAICAFIVCPLIPAVVALFLASSAKRNIDASNGALDGESLVTAARIIAWINIGLCLLLIVGGIVLIIVAAATSSTSNSLSGLGATLTASP